MHVQGCCFAREPCGLLTFSLLSPLWWVLQLPCYLTAVSNLKVGNRLANPQNDDLNR